MSQYNFEDIDPYIDTGINLATDLNGWKAAVESGHSGTSRPSYVRAGMSWVNTSANPWKCYTYDGVDDILVGLLDYSGNKFYSDTSSISVSNISSLRALKKEFSSKVFVEGYYTRGDGGGGYYYYDSSDTTSSDNGGTIIVASDGARWKLVHNGEVSVKQFGAKGDDSNDDTSYLQTCISTALANNLSIRVPSGTYKVTSGLTKSSSIKCPNIRGDGCRTTAIKAYSFAADTSILTLIGGSGTVSLAVIEGITFYGDSATPNCVEITGQCGVIIKECEFGTSAIGILAHNKTSGQFTEYCVAENCVFRTSCIESLVYRRTGGDASFHGTGLRNCMINETAGATSKKIRIGGTGSTSNAIIVYNAPMSFQIWKNATNPIIENNTTYYNTVLHGTITLELFSGALGSAWDICTGTNKTYFVGNISNGTGNMAKLGTLVPSESFETKSDGTVNVWRKPYRVPAALMAPGANTLINFSAVNGESYQVRAVFTSNASPWRYVYLLEVYCSTTINTVTTLATLGSYYAGDNAQPVFSMSGSSLIATQAGWASDRIYCEMSVVQTASCINFQL